MDGNSGSVEGSTKSGKTKDKDEDSSSSSSSGSDKDDESDQPSKRSISFSACISDVNGYSTIYHSQIYGEFQTQQGNK